MPLEILDMWVGLGLAPGLANSQGQSEGKRG